MIPAALVMANRGGSEGEGAASNIMAVASEEASYLGEEQNFSSSSSWFGLGGSSGNGFSESTSSRRRPDVGKRSTSTTSFSHYLFQGFEEEASVVSAMTTKSAARHKSRSSRSRDRKSHKSSSASASSSRSTSQLETMLNGLSGEEHRKSGNSQQEKSSSRKSKRKGKKEKKRSSGHHKSSSSSRSKSHRSSESKHKAKKEHQQQKERQQRDEEEEEEEDGEEEVVIARVDGNGKMYRYQPSRSEIDSLEELLSTSHSAADVSATVRQWEEEVEDPRLQTIELEDDDDDAVFHDANDGGELPQHSGTTQLRSSPLLDPILTPTITEEHDEEDDDGQQTAISKDDDGERETDSTSPAQRKPMDELEETRQQTSKSLSGFMSMSLRSLTTDLTEEADAASIMSEVLRQRDKVRRSRKKGSKSSSSKSSSSNSVSSAPSRISSTQDYMKSFGLKSFSLTDESVPTHESLAVHFGNRSRTNSEDATANVDDDDQSFATCHSFLSTASSAVGTPTKSSIKSTPSKSKQGSSSVSNVVIPGDDDDDDNYSPSLTVSFGSVECRPYNLIVGDNPACSDWLPLSLDWVYGDATSTPVDLHVQQRQRRFESRPPPSKEELLCRRLKWHERRAILISGFGYSDKDLRQEELAFAESNGRVKKSRMAAAAHISHTTAKEWLGAKAQTKRSNTASSAPFFFKSVSKPHVDKSSSSSSASSSKVKVPLTAVENAHAAAAAEPSTVIART